jgi:hypothetical protein
VKLWHVILSSAIVLAYPTLRGVKTLVSIINPLIGFPDSSFVVYLSKFRVRGRMHDHALPRALKYMSVHPYITYGCVLEWIRAIRRYHLVIGSISPSVYFIAVRIVSVLGGEAHIMLTGRGRGWVHVSNNSKVSCAGESGASGTWWESFGRFLLPHTLW